VIKKAGQDMTTTSEKNTPIPTGIYFLKVNDGFYQDDGGVASGFNFMGAALSCRVVFSTERVPADDQGQRGVSLLMAGLNF
jgi:hypothetical protein